MKALRLLTLSAMALTALASCQKEAPESPASDSGNKQKLTFTARGEDAGSRTALASDNGILWNLTDNITVFSAGIGSTYTVESLSADARSVTFSGISTLSDTYYALYPASNTASISGDIITATLPGTQVATAGSFADKTNLSVAKSSDSNLYFKNVGALLAITVRNSGLTGITVESIGGEALTGTAQIACNDGEPSVTVTSALTQVTLSGSFEAGQTYYCTVFPGNFASGFRITYHKEGYKAVYADSKAVELTRNSNHLLADITVPDSDWRADEAFAVGDAVRIRNSAEEGQNLSYIPEGYWNSGTDHYLNDGTYNYEIFTRLTEGQNFYFQSEGNYLFALNAEGTQVASIKKASQAAYAAPADGIYRIRMVLPSGTAAVQQISRYTFSQYSVLGANLNYVGNGIWEYKNLSMRRNSQSWNNRYKFVLHFSDESVAYYGRWSTNKSNPVYGTTGADYFYVQPCDNNDNWEPCFKFPSACEVDEDRYYGDLTLSMNNDGGHYTHSITNVRDSQNLPDITPGESIFIGGTDEAGQKMVYVGAEGYYNTAMSNFGDANNIDTDAIGDYDYEIFTRLKAGEKIYFSNADGSKYFAPVAEGNAMSKIVAPEKASYTAKSDGVWRIRANFATGKCCIRRIDQVRVELQYHNSVYYTLNYVGNGVWRKEDQVIEWGVESWDAHLSRYILKMWFNKDQNGDSINVWQVYGATTNKGNARPAQDDDGSYWNLQPYSGQNWDQIFVYGSWMTDNDHNGRYTATVSAYMNDTYSHYTHRFTDVKDTLQ